MKQLYEPPLVFPARNERSHCAGETSRSHRRFTGVCYASNWDRFNKKLVLDGTIYYTHILISHLYYYIMDPYIMNPYIILSQLGTMYENLWWLKRWFVEWYPIEIYWDLGDPRDPPGIDGEVIGPHGPAGFGIWVAARGCGGSTVEQPPGVPNKHGDIPNLDGTHPTVQISKANILQLNNNEDIGHKTSDFNQSEIVWKSLDVPPCQMVTSVTAGLQHGCWYHLVPLGTAWL